MRTITIKSLILLIVISCAILTPLTASEDFNSLSAHADTSFFYNLMHALGVGFWMMFTSGTYRNAERFRNVRDLDILTAISMALILGFNMYWYPVAHNIVTGVTLLLASINVLYTFQWKYLGYVPVGAAIGIFAWSFLDPSFDFTTGEVYALSCLGIGKISYDWINVKKL